MGVLKRVNGVVGQGQWGREGQVRQGLGCGSGRGVAVVRQEVTLQALLELVGL